MYICVFWGKLEVYTQVTFEYIPLQKRIGLMIICQLLFILRRYEKGLFEEKRLSAVWRMGIMSPPSGGKCYATFCHIYQSIL